MATRIHVTGEQTPRPAGFDTNEVAAYAAGIMGLDPGSYTLVRDASDRANKAQVPHGWTRRPSAYRQETEPDPRRSTRVER
jgi:hypothetical protein